MDSPEPDKITSITVTTTSSSSDSVAIQDSPIFSYLSNLSPIKPVKAAPVAPGFPGLNSPPIVFTSPRVNPIRERSYLKRLQYSQSASAELSLLDDRGQKISTGPDISGKFSTQLSSGLTPCTEKEVDNKGPMEDKVGSPSGCVDEYLTDAVEVESANLSLKQSHDESSNGFTNSKESISQHDTKNNIRKDDETAVAFPTILEKAEEDLQGKSSSNNIKTDDIDGKQGSGEIPFCVCPNIESNLSTGHAYEEKYYDYSFAQNAGAGCKNRLDDMSQFQLESLETIQEHEDCDETAAAVSNEPVENKLILDPKNAGAGCQDGSDDMSQFQLESLETIQEHEDCDETTAAVSNEPVENMLILDPKVSQYHRGTRKRCLQFEEVRQNIIENSPGSWNPSNNVTSSWSCASPTDLEVLESSCTEIGLISSGQQMGKSTQPTISMTYPQKCGNSTFTMSKPAGIGLHLNSIFNAMPMGCGTSASMKSTEKGYLSIKGKKPVSIIGCHLSENTKNSSTSLNVIEKVSASTEVGCQETQSSVAATSSISPHFVTPLNNAAHLKPIEYQATQYDKSKSISASADSVEELNQVNPKKKRKKASGASDGDGCKRCNCKKTKCLKLYCDCFAAGIYCAEPCACQGCFNRPEYEDTVLEIRQQIETRNPLAFAPKIVQRVSESPANSSGEDVNCSTPSSAKHKRGCNCKKSMCLKKYCECYQANVGCSDGCRCDGCKNVYGRKEEYSMTKDVLNKRPVDGRLEVAFDMKLEMAVVQTELCDPHSLTPLTPSFQCSDHGKDASKSRFASRRYIPSPDSNLAELPPYGKSPGSPRNSDTHDQHLRTRKDILNSVSCHQELDYDIEETGDEFSPRSDGIANICHLTTLPEPPRMSMASSTSTKKRDWINVSRDQLYPGGGHFSSVSSLRWRSSPITPVTPLGGAKLDQVLDSDNKNYDILEDDTPEILKDTSTPLNAVKVSSPNKKRVSPPHSRLNELGSSSSAGLRSGRKFILQAVPSFPPLTPCIDSKDSTNQNINDLQDCSGNK